MWCDFAITLCSALAANADIAVNIVNHFTAINVNRLNQMNLLSIEMIGKRNTQIQR